MDGTFYTWRTLKVGAPVPPAQSLTYPPLSPRRPSRTAAPKPTAPPRPLTTVLPNQVICIDEVCIDEVDSLLGARGSRGELEATRKMKNEFVSCSDGLRTNFTERVLVLAATNRTFDLDDAVIRRITRRLMVDLPKAENRAKIRRVCGGRTRMLTWT